MSGILVVAAARPAPWLPEGVGPGVAEALIEEGRPELIILDLEVDGAWALLLRMSPALHRRALPPVLAIADAGDRVGSRRALGLGAEDVVRKPTDGEELVLRAQRLVRLRRQQLRLEGEIGRLRRLISERAHQS